MIISCLGLTSTVCLGNGMAFDDEPPSDVSTMRIIRLNAPDSLSVMTAGDDVSLFVVLHFDTLDARVVWNHAQKSEAWLDVSPFASLEDSSELPSSSSFFVSSLSWRPSSLRSALRKFLPSNAFMFAMTKSSIAV